MMNERMNEEIYVSILKIFNSLVLHSFNMVPPSASPFQIHPTIHLRKLETKNGINTPNQHHSFSISFTSFFTYIWRKQLLELITLPTQIFCKNLWTFRCVNSRWNRATTRGSMCDLQIIKYCYSEKQRTTRPWEGNDVGENLASPPQSQMCKSDSL